MKKFYNIPFTSLSDCSLIIDLILVGIFKSSSVTRAEVLEMYANRTFPQIFGIMEYKMWRAFPIIYINAVSVLLYSFGDQLIMMINFTLGNYFSIYNWEALALRKVLHL